MSAADPTLREVGVAATMLWTAPDAPRDLDAAAVRDDPDPGAWAAGLDEEARLGLHGRTLSQLLLGESVHLLETSGAWSRVVAPGQPSSADERGYPGWLPTAHLAEPAPATEGPTAVVTGRSAHCDVDAGPGLSLSFGTRLPVASSTPKEVELLLPGGRRGFVRADDVAVPTPTPHGGEVVATARTFLGLRYLWGGTSTWGLDCSGLVHLTLRSLGVTVPRDAFDQAATLTAVPLDDVRPGDLYFFARPGRRVHHVGFVSRTVEPDGTRWMLHAPEGGTIEDAPMAAARVEQLVSAARLPE